MTVRTERYEGSMGKLPRGYGNWWFGDKAGLWEFSFYGSYSEAKREAIRTAREAGIDTIYVLS